MKLLLKIVLTIIVFALFVLVRAIKEEFGISIGFLGYFLISAVEIGLIILIWSNKFLRSKPPK